MSSATMGKKNNKGKKATDPSETSKLLAAKISQLEQDAVGEKEQEAEIGACYQGVRGVSRDLQLEISRALAYVFRPEAGLGH